MFSGMNSSMLGLELPLHQNPTNPPNPHQLHHPQIVSYVPHEPHHQQQPPPVAVKYPYPTKPKPQQSNLSDDDEQGFAADDSNGDGKKKISPWQRMKWTDMMVRLLITAVFYIGDEGGSEPADHAGKKKPVGLHNTCRHSTSNSGAHPSPDAAAEPSHLPQQQQQRCFHATETTTSSAAAVAAGDGLKSGDEDDEEEEEDESDEEEEDEEDEEIEGRQEEEEETESRKRARKGGITAGMQQLSAEVMGVVQDGGRSPWEKKQWMKSRLLQLEEQQVSYQAQAFELEKQRLKWVKFRSKKERDMERAKLENEKRRLENERMMLMVKQKELDLMGMHHYQHQQQHSSNKRGDPSSITG